MANSLRVETGSFSTQSGDAFLQPTVLGMLDYVCLCYAKNLLALCVLYMHHCNITTTRRGILRKMFPRVSTFITSGDESAQRATSDES